MRQRTSAIILTGILATGAGGAIAITPASATTSDNAVTSRLAHIKGALTGLVKDGTLTQSQADKVAGTLDSKLPKHGKLGKLGMKGPGGHMGGPGAHMGGRGGHFGWMGMTQTQDAAAKALGLTTDQLRAALRSGKSLADLAKDKKVSVDSLVKAMVTSIEDRLAAAVKSGTLTQAKADRMKSSLAQRITDRINGVRPDRKAGPRGLDRPSSHEDTSRGMSNSPSGTT